MRMHAVRSSSFKWCSNAGATRPADGTTSRQGSQAHQENGCAGAGRRINCFTPASPTSNIGRKGAYRPSAVTESLYGEF